jgi:hypothetical protein
MALVLADRVKETTTTTGTGTVTLLGASTGFQSFTAVGDGNSTYYTISGQGTSEWEVGIGTYTSSGTTLSRTTVLSSSNSGSLVNFSAGTKDVFVTYPAGKQISSDYPNALGVVTPAAGTFTTITGQTEVLKGTGQNLFIRSQTFSYWCGSGSSNVSATDNAATAPDGTTTASSLIPNTTNGLHRTYSPITASVSSGATYTMSVYAKANGYRYLFFNCGQSTGTAVFDVQAGTVTNGTATSANITAVSGATGWYRLSITGNATITAIPSLYWQVQSTYALGDQSFAGDGTSSIYLWGAQLEIGSTLNTYIPTTTTVVYGTPTLSFSGVAGLGLQSDGSLYVSPAGTGALQAQATTSSTVGGNARGANAVDWQTSRNGASQVASGGGSFIGAGTGNTPSGAYSSVVGGGGNSITSTYAFNGGGQNNGVTGIFAVNGGGYANSVTGFYGSVLGGSINSTTSSSAVTTQSATMNGTTAVTLSGSNANIKVGQFITGTSINYPNTYVAAISGTSLTLSQAASGSSTSTLSFYTPHGVVVGGGNNQATGSYSFIGGGGDAGTAANRNTASGDWSFVGGGMGNTASASGAFVGGGGNAGSGNVGNNASGVVASILGGQNNQASSYGASVLGGRNNTASGNYSVASGYYATTRGIQGYQAFAATQVPIASSLGVTQAGLLLLGKQTTDATATVLTSDGAAAGTTNQVILPNNSAYYYKAKAISTAQFSLATTATAGAAGTATITFAAQTVAPFVVGQTIVVAGITPTGFNGTYTVTACTTTTVQYANATTGAQTVAGTITATSLTKAWTIEGAIMRTSGVAGTRLIGSPTTTVVASDTGTSAWTLAATADTTNGGLTITFTGAAATTIRTVCRVETSEVTY